MRSTEASRVGPSGLDHAANQASTVSAGSGVQAIGDGRGEDRELEAPALHEGAAVRDLGEGVGQAETRGGAARLERDRHLRSADRGLLVAGGIPVGEDDAPRRIDVDDLAGHLDPVGVPDAHPPADRGVDLRSGAPPGRPQRAVREVLEHDVDRRADVDGAGQEMREGAHADPLRGRTERGVPGRGPRRAWRSSACHVRRQSALSHMRSSSCRTGPSASRRAR